MVQVKIFVLLVCIFLLGGTALVQAQLRLGGSAVPDSTSPQPVLRKASRWALLLNLSGTGVGTELRRGDRLGLLAETGAQLIPFGDNITFIRAWPKLRLESRWYLLTRKHHKEAWTEIGAGEKELYITWMVLGLYNPYNTVVTNVNENSFTRSSWNLITGPGAGRMRRYGRRGFTDFQIGPAVWFWQAPNGALRIWPMLNVRLGIGVFY